MTIQFRCPGCAGEFQVPETLAGVVSHCVRCGAVVTVPHAAAPMPGPGFIAAPTANPTAGFGARPAPSARPSPPPGGFAPQPSFGPRPATAAPGAASASEGWSPVLLVAMGSGAAVVVLLLLLIVVRSLSGPRAPGAPDEGEGGGAAESSGGGLFSSWTDGSGIAIGPTPGDPLGGSDPFANAGRDDPGPAPLARDASAPRRVTPEGSLRISIQDSSHCEIGPPGCPIVIANESVWRLKDNQEQAKLEGHFLTGKTTALSEDGHWVAQDYEPPPDPRHTKVRLVRIWDARTGKVARDLSNPQERPVFWLQFVRHDYLLVGMRSPSEILALHVPSGNAFPPLPVSEDALPNCVSVSRDGRRLAFVDGERILMVRMATGETEAVMGRPSGAFGAVDPAANDPKKVLEKLRGFALSPDGSELALLTSHPRMRLLCWNAQGVNVFDEGLDDLTVPREFARLRWIPDGSGWLYGDSVIDRDSKRCVFQLQSAFMDFRRMGFADRDRLIGVFPDREKRLTDVVIPWEAIRKSLAAFDAGAPAFVGRGRSVAVQIEVKNASRQPDETRRMLLEAFTRRLAKYGIGVASAAPATFRIRMTEEIQEELTRSLPGRNSLVNPRPKQTFRPILAKLSAELSIAGRNAPVWQQEVKTLNSMEYLDTFDEATIHRTLQRNAAFQVEHLDIPFFVPESSDLIALPILRKAP